MPRLPVAQPREGQEPPALELFAMVANAETAYEPWLRYGGTLLTRLELDPLLRELVILQVAHEAASEYEWVQHDPIARALGATAEQVEAIAAGRVDDAIFDADQALALRVAQAMVRDGAAAEQDVVELRSRLGTRQAVELMLVVSQYRGIAMFIASAGLEPEAPAGAEQLLRRSQR
jgi:alkylhydroperoxidase family enzyme